MDEGGGLMAKKKRTAKELSDAAKKAWVTRRKKKNAKGRAA